MEKLFVILFLCASVIISQTNGQVFIKTNGGSGTRSRSPKNQTAGVSASVPPPIPSENAFNGFQDGLYYTIASVASGKFLTVEGVNFSRGANVIAQDWNADDNQVWLALLAPKSFRVSAVQGRDVNGASPRFLLIPKRQAYTNPNAAKNDDLNANPNVNYTLATLPDLTEVLTLDSVTGNLTTEILIRGSSSQQWVLEDGGSGKIFIRNLGNNQCVKNFDYKPENIFRKIASFISRLRRPYKPKPEPRPLGTLDCSTTDVTQKWFPERL